MYCEKIPKGFEKYYKKGQAGAAKPPPQAEARDAPKEAPRSEPSKSPSGGGSPGSTGPKKDWNLGMFTPSGQSRGGGQGRPIGGEQPDRDKMLIFGAISGIALVAILAYYEMGYKEIAWKEFVNNYLSRGQVERLEVVNKKWVRVRLTPGSYTESNAVL